MWLRFKVRCAVTRSAVLRRAGCNHQRNRICTALELLTRCRDSVYDERSNELKSSANSKNAVNFHLCTRRDAFYRDTRQPMEPEKTFLCMDLSRRTRTQNQ